MKNFNIFDAQLNIIKDFKKTNRLIIGKNEDYTFISPDGCYGYFLRNNSDLIIYAPERHSDGGDKILKEFTDNFNSDDRCYKELVKPRNYIGKTCKDIGHGRIYKTLDNSFYIAINEKLLSKFPENATLYGTKNQYSPVLVADGGILIGIVMPFRLVNIENVYENI